MATPANAKAPLSAIIGTIVFVLFVPGTGVLLIPYLLCGWRFDSPVPGGLVTRAAGAALFIAAIPTFASFLYRFVAEGRGTPAPIAPPRRLVTGGAFQRIRNPGYVSVLAMVVGQGLFFGSLRVLAYAVLLAFGFHLFVILYEEPGLRARFGADYEDYCRMVPRWIPRLGSAGSRRG